MGDRQKELFRPALDQIIDLDHPLVRLAGKIDWAFLGRELGEVYRARSGHPPLPVRLKAGLLILKLPRPPHPRSRPQGPR
jgi:IS5 family transposase